MPLDIEVNVSPDHLLSVAKATPIAAILELVWNALDADATVVGITIDANELGGVEGITVTDNGTGISYEDAHLFFALLGGSWKKSAGSSKQLKRVLHGKEGKGRFKAFSIGTKVSWRSVSNHNGTRQLISITAQPGNVNRFHVPDPIDTEENTGTVVKIEGIQNGLHSLMGDDVPVEIAEHLAPYLLRYPDVCVQYRGQAIDPKSVVKDDETFSLVAVQDLNGEMEIPTVRIIEWWRPSRRELHLCDPSGFSLAVTTPKIHVPGYNFTAYLSSVRIRQLNDRNELLLWEVNKSIDDLVEEAKWQIKGHRRSTKARDAHLFIKQLKEDKIYPYKEEPRDLIESTTRQMFDVLAVNLANLYPRFSTTDDKSKSLSLHLLARAVEDNPKSIQKILTEVLGLSRDKQDELAEILEDTSLDHIISASKTVTDRLKFLDGLHHILFSEDIKPILKERTHLHKIIEGETWVFGEEYNLTASDKSLTEVLRKHRALLGDPVIIDEPVVREDGKVGIVDLMLSRSLKNPNPKQHEHLIIELKRPAQKITSSAIHQTRSYAKAIANDERFKGTDTKWTFIALSNDLDDIVQDDARQPEKPPGLVFEDPNGRYKVWAKRWSEIIDDARARLSFFQEKFAIEMAEGAGLEHMRRVYAKHLPTEDLTLQEGEDREAEETMDKPNESVPSKRGRRVKRMPKQPATEPPMVTTHKAPQE